MVLHSLPSRNLEAAQVQLGLAAFHFLLAKRVEGRSPHTLRWYYNALQELARFTNGHAPTPSLELLTPVEVREWMAHLLDKGLAKVSVNCYFRAVRCFYNWCKAEGIIEATPLTNIKPPPPGKHLLPVFAEAHLRLLLALCPSKLRSGARDQAIILTFLATGVRRAEMAGLTLGSIDFVRELVRVRGKGDKERLIYLSPVAQKAILQWLRHRRPTVETNALWLSEEGRPLTDMGIDMMVRKLGRRAGVQGVRCSCHTFRHTFAINFLRSGASVRHLQEVMGHTSMKPLETYLRMLTAEDALEVHRQKDPMRQWKF